MKLFNFFKKTETKPRPTSDVKFMDSSSLKKLSAKDYCNRVDDYSVRLLTQINTEFTDNSISAIDTLLTAAAALSIKTNMTMPTLLTTMLNVYLGIAKVSPEEVMADFAVHSQSPVTDKSKLN
jgi:hypothetical protein